MNTSLNELLYLVRLGNEEASRYIYRFYYQKVRSLARYYERRDRYMGDIEDYVQVGMMNFDKLIKSYRDDREATFTTYVTVCVKRRLQTYATKRKNERSKEDYQYVSLDAIRDVTNRRIEEVVADPKITYKPDEQYKVHEVLDNFEWFIDHNATTQDKRIFLLLQMGYKVKEVSEMLGISKKTVYNSVYRLYKKYEKHRMAIDGRQ